ncbi:MAG: class I SAM-dependent methyltransferase [Acidimicrobiales bacterium]
MTTLGPDESVARHRSALIEAARATRGFMPDDEGLALARVAETLVSSGAAPGPPPLVVEIGAYCGRSTLYLAAGVAAGLALVASELEQGTERARAAVFSVDHHHGSAENQAGWEHHDADLVDPRTGRLDTLARWRSAIDDAGAADRVIAVVGDSPTVASYWQSPIGLLFIDGGHGAEPAWADYNGWVPHVAGGGFLVIHDVFEDPRDGGRPPYELYCHALSSGEFAVDRDLCRASLRVLRRISVLTNSSPRPRAADERR